ncbi:MAG: hypothetical protein KJ674_00910 [Nanoarchaeota archaeon]|nr:hypothetical protein [Nanoarchaeota archaeon]
MLKRGQSAMEYLLTYGWAILIVLISLSLLFYLGVFSPNTPNTCIGTAPLVCGDVKIMAGGGTFIGGVAIFSVGASGTSGESIPEVTLNGEDCSVDTSSLSWSDNSMVTFACSMDISDLDLNEGDKASGEFSFTYTPSYGGVSHTTKNSFSGSVESCSGSGVGDCFDDYTMIGCTGGNVECISGECVYNLCI